MRTISDSCLRDKPGGSLAGGSREEEWRCLQLGIKFDVKPQQRHLSQRSPIYWDRIC
jgi:hypothetical protein